jgi:1-deoxy-D-xylulose-5-phosphate synthase
VDTLGNLRKLDGPQFLHVVTRKGKGYVHAEQDSVLYHGVSKFDPANGIAAKCARDEGLSASPAYAEIFGQWLCDMAAQDEKLVGITPAMCEGSGMVEFAKNYPARYFDVGIAEQHALTFAAGLACEGFRPVVAIYSTFLQRAYDQFIHDIALQNLPVVLAIDRGGLVGADGATHAGSFDLSFLRCIPGMTLMTPADENECRQMLFTAYRLGTPAAVRYPREMRALPVGKGELRREGRRVAILAFGAMLAPALEAGERLGASVANMRFVKPLDAELILALARGHELLVTVEENAVQGGAGSAVAECLAQHGVSVPLLLLGLPDSFVEQGEHAQMLADCGLDAAGLIARIEQRLNA